MYDIEQQPATKRPARKPKRRALPPGCFTCKGQAWVASGFFMARCPETTCERGQWYRARDRERQAVTT